MEVEVVHFVEQKLKAQSLLLLIHLALVTKLLPMVIAMLVTSLTVI